MKAKPIDKISPRVLSGQVAYLIVNFLPIDPTDKNNEIISVKLENGFQNVTIFAVH